MTEGRVVNRGDVKVRDLRKEDVEAYLEYWHGANDTVLDQLGIDRRKLYPRRKMQEALLRQIEINDTLLSSKTSRLAVTYRGEFAGVHELTDLQVDKQAVMHAHLLKNFRGRGIGTIAYVEAMNVYFARFQFERVVFKTPTCNGAATRIKEKLGLRSEGEGRLDLPILKEPIDIQTFYVYRGDMPRLFQRISCRQST